MATYGLKYLCEYRSDIRDRILYRIEIEERDAVAATDEIAIIMRPYSDVFSIKWGNSDDHEYAAVKGSSLTLKILCLNDMEFLPLFTVDPQKYRVTIYEHRKGTSGKFERLMLWRGFLSANSYKEDFARPPYVVSLSATDGFALLSSMPFQSDSGAKFTGRTSISKLLDGCMEKLGLDLPLAEWLYMDDAKGKERSLDKIYLDQDRIYNIKKEINWLDVLEFCLKPFLGQIFQAGGTIHVRRIGSLRGSDRPTQFYSNAKILGHTRSVCRRMWINQCDFRSSSELDLRSPYRKVVVSADNSNLSDSDEAYYNKKNWVDKVNIANSYYLGNRVVVAGITVGSICLALPPFFEPANVANINISLLLSNLMTAAQIVGEIAIIAKVGTSKLKWNPDSKNWAADTGQFDANFTVDPVGATDPTWGYRVSIYTPVSRLHGYSFQTNITNLPPKNDEDDYQLYIRIIFQPANLHVESRAVLVMSDINIRTSAADSKSEAFSTSISVSSISAENCEINMPLRDGGYRLNMRAILACPITDENDVPIVSWLTPAERGDLLHLAGNSILRLRSAICRQITGELRCPVGVDLNTLFIDGKFTNAVYYVNSFEFFAARQIYKAQLRELIDTKCMPPVEELSQIHVFASSAKLAGSLHGTLFFRIGTESFRVEMLNSETGVITELPYSAARLDIRKGLNAVVVQVGDSDLYALNNVGDVLSYLNADTKDILNYETALYDADRGSWVSFNVNSATAKTAITVFTDKLELESQDEFNIVAQGMLLISNGYVIRGEGFTTYWHNYELHSSDSLLSVTDANTPMSESQFDTLAVSDSLLIKRHVSGFYNVSEVCRRTGNKFLADEILYSCESAVWKIVEAKCNCAISAILIKQDDQAELHIYDARDARRRIIALDPDVTVEVCGPCVYVLVNDILNCYSLENTAPLREEITRVNFLNPNFNGQRQTITISISDLSLTGDIDVNFYNPGIASLTPAAVLEVIGGKSPLSGYCGHNLIVSSGGYRGRAKINESGVITVLLMNRL